MLTSHEFFFVIIVPIFWHFVTVFRVTVFRILIWGHFLTFSISFSVILVLRHFSTFSYVDQNSPEFRTKISHAWSTHFWVDQKFEDFKCYLTWRLFSENNSDGWCGQKWPCNKRRKTYRLIVINWKFKKFCHGLEFRFETESD